MLNSHRDYLIENRKNDSNVLRLIHQGLEDPTLQKLQQETMPST